MPEPNSLEDFVSRFDALQEEARGFGIRSVVALNDSDPLSDEESCVCLYRGGQMNASGLAQYAADFILRAGEEQ